jgi:hypothetical protein
MATIITTIIIPTQTPALKIPAMAWQLLSVTARKRKENKIVVTLNFFILMGF